METVYVRTEQGRREIAERLSNLTPWQRTVLILVGTSGKSLGDLRQALTGMPDSVEHVLQTLIERGLAVMALPQTEIDPIIIEPAVIDPVKGARRHLGYLADMIGNADAKTAFALTLKLKKISSLDDVRVVLPAFHAALTEIRGREEAYQLLEKLGLAECA